MAAHAENEFPTFLEARDVLTTLIEKGFGDLPMQLVVVPDSTLQAIGRVMFPEETKPALMIDFPGTGGRLAVGLISDRALNGPGMPSRKDH